MPVPNIYEDGSATHGTGALSVPWGTHNDQFTAVLLVTCAGDGVLGTPVQSGADGTWNLIASCAVGSGAGSVQLAAYWCWATTGSMSNVTVPDTGDHTSAKMWMLQNVVRSGNPINMFATQTVPTPSASISVPCPNTTVQNCLVFCAAGHAQDTGTPPGGSGWANASLTGVGFAGQYSTANGTGGGYMGGVGSKATAGVCGTFTHTWAGGATAQANLVWAISDTATAGGSPQNAEPLPASAAATGVDPTLSPGDVSIAPLPGAAAATGVDPALTPGAVTLAPLPASAAATGVDPVITGGAVSIAPLPGAATAVGVDPTLAPGAVTLAPLPASGAATGVDPTLTPGAVNLSPAPASAGAAGVDPTLVPGSATSAPLPASAVATGVDPSLSAGAVSFAAGAAQAAATGVDPALNPGAVVAAPAPASAAATGVDPTLSASTFLEPLPGVATAGGVNPAFAPGAVSISPLPGAAAATGVDPTLSQGVDASFAPAPASAAATGVDPTLVTGVEVEGVVVVAWSATIEVHTLTAQLEVSVRSATIEVK